MDMDLDIYIYIYRSKLWARMVSKFNLVKLRRSGRQRNLTVIGVIGSIDELANV